MRIYRLLATLASQWLRCALQFLLIVSVLVAGVSPSTAFTRFVGSEETDTPCEEQEEEEEEEEEVTRSSDPQKRYAKGSLRRWHQGDRSLRGFSTVAHRFHQGHCLSNGLRAPLLR